jgi:hypothetical protein
MSQARRLSFSESIGLFSTSSGCIEGSFKGIVTNDSCRTGELERNGNNLDLLFTQSCNMLDSVSPNSLLIPLVCVGVVVGVAVILIIVVMSNQTLRKKILPFSTRRRDSQPAPTVEV